MFLCAKHMHYMNYALVKKKRGNLSKHAEQQIQHENISMLLPNNDKQKIAKQTTINTAIILGQQNSNTDRRDLAYD